jgi:hypothetical protein
MLGEPPPVPERVDDLAVALTERGVHQRPVLGSARGERRAPHRVHVGAVQVEGDRRAGSVPREAALPMTAANHGRRVSAYAAWVPGAVATRIIVFGRGLVAEGESFRLTRQSSERVDALVSYVRQNAGAFAVRRGRVVFSGGWAGAAEGFDPPPPQCREGSLMLARAMAADIGGTSLAGYADAFKEIESDCTLENVLLIKEDGYFDGVSFTARDPLGLVAHREHLPRVSYLVRKAFGISGDAVVTITAGQGRENYTGGLPESVLLPITRVAFLGARGHSSLRGRHRMLVAWDHRLRSLPQIGDARPG